MSKTTCKTLNQSRIQIIDIVTNLTAISEENAASTEETSASTVEVSAIVDSNASHSEDLKTIATELDATMDIFKL